MPDLDKRAEQSQVLKLYALRMTANGAKPWIGGSRIELTPPKIKAQRMKMLDEAFAELRGA